MEESKLASTPSVACTRVPKVMQGKWGRQRVLVSVPKAVQADELPHATAVSAVFGANE
jgi:hypothetical protein